MVNTGKIIKYNVFAEWQVDDTCYKVIFVFAETYIFIQVSRSDQIEVRLIGLDLQNHFSDGLPEKWFF